ncbi:MAG: alpha/beta hydrolase [Verrucomicrobiaceae bacterium]|nr:alpha/beta hydrolase [Verrucomicrobiaceae bacterium]
MTLLFRTALLFSLIASLSAQAAEWNGFENLDFMLDGRKARLVKPKTPSTHRPWIWRTEFFGHEPQADLALLAKGFHVAYIDVQNMYGAPKALDIMDAFYTHLVKEHQLHTKTVLEGFSRGGLFALNWAIRHPDRTAALYLDAPVCTFTSWPAGWGIGKGSPNDWARCKAVYELADDDAARAYKLNPVDNLATLAKARVPIISVCGDADKVVPLEENSALLKTRYTALGGPMELIAKPGVDHHPHSLKDPTPIVDFILKHTQP